DDSCSENRLGHRGLHQQGAWPPPRKAALHPIDIKIRPAAFVDVVEPAAGIAVESTPRRASRSMPATQAAKPATDASSRHGFKDRNMFSPPAMSPRNESPAPLMPIVEGNLGEQFESGD